jgi:hypothetical protein
MIILSHDHRDCTASESAAAVRCHSAECRSWQRDCHSHSGRQAAASHCELAALAAACVTRPGTARVLADRGSRNLALPSPAAVFLFNCGSGRTARLRAVLCDSLASCLVQVEMDSTPGPLGSDDSQVDHRMHLSTMTWWAASVPYNARSEKLLHPLYFQVQALKLLDQNLWWVWASLLAPPRSTLGRLGNPLLIVSNMIV